MTRRQRLIKRVLDLVISIAALVLLAPLFLLVVVLIKLDSKGPLLFRQQRLGENGKIFTIYKFRTMHHNAEPLFNENGSKLVTSQDPRVTRVGKVLRGSGIDELAQLVNVLRAEMSIVGPRPDEPYALELYSDAERRKLLVKPGITGLAEVTGRETLPWRGRLKRDLEYVENYSLCLDFKIIFLTWKIWTFRPPRPQSRRR
jgi:lipopolysaccharide/colanic/teichoic acid biosynthesis glycosyltransferase